MPIRRIARARRKCSPAVHHSRRSCGAGDSTAFPHFPERRYFDFFLNFFLAIVIIGYLTLSRSPFLFHNRIGRVRTPVKRMRARRLVFEMRFVFLSLSRRLSQPKSKRTVSVYKSVYGQQTFRFLNRTKIERFNRVQICSTFPFRFRIDIGKAIALTLIHYLVSLRNRKSSTYVFFFNFKIVADLAQLGTKINVNVQDMKIK